jgi:dTDP-4-amino-4,6-dideoxygalactose transaminase
MPICWERNELAELTARGYKINDPWNAITVFENKIAKFTGSSYAISVDSCSSALFLAMKYCDVTAITIPKHTYISVPMMAKMHSVNCNVTFQDTTWNKWYSLNPISNNSLLDIIDCAVTLERNMYQNDTLQCISFQHRKPLKIGKGGMILTDNMDAASWLRKASYDGRDRSKMFNEDLIDALGYHMYMTPEDGARGILLFDEYIETLDIIGSVDYPDITKFTFVKEMQ